MIKKVDSAKKLDNKKKMGSAIFKEIQGRGLLSYYLSDREARLIIGLDNSNLAPDIKDHPKSLRSVHEMKKDHFKDSIARKSSIRKFAKKATKKSSSQSTMAVSVERKQKPKGSPRKVEIQSLPQLYMICDLYLKHSCQIPKQITCRTKASREEYKLSYVSLLQREFSNSSNLGWPFHRRTVSENQNGLTESEDVQNSKAQLAMNLRTRFSIDACDDDKPEIRDREKVEVSSSPDSFDDIESPKSRPGWPLLLVQFSQNIDDSSSDSEIMKHELPVNQLEIDHLLKEADSSDCKIFKYEHLKAATSHFSSEHVIGEGGCSSVYKGHIESGETVAVKVLKPYKEAWNDFSLQVKIASSIKHENIVPLLGICLENGLLISVHDFFPKGSLEDYLHGNKSVSVLPWKVRFNVAVAIAEALNYLHNECIIIHRDVKSSNILLTSEFQPQLSDFGLAIWGSVDSGYLVDCDVAGTFGYIAPEYFMHGIVSEKIDVYAFGVVLLELLTGRRPICERVPKGHESLVKWAEKLLDGGDYVGLLDPKLKGDFDVVQVQRMVLAASLCICKSPRVRPKIAQILKLLKEYKDARGKFYTSFMESIKADYQDNDEHSIFDYGFSNSPRFSILDANNISMSQSSDGSDATPPIIKEIRRPKLRDFLNQSQD